jgi:hypothetical protein
MVAIRVAAFLFSAIGSIPHYTSNFRNTFMSIPRNAINSKVYRTFVWSLQLLVFTAHILPEKRLLFVV